MKRALCAIFSIILMVVPLQAFAKGLSYIPDDCFDDPCTCFIQRGDEGNFVVGIIRKLYAAGYVPQDREKRVTREVEQGIIQFQADHGLPQTGLMDDDTLTWLVWGMSPEALDAERPIIPGAPSTYPITVYVPTDGGKKRHHDPTCSGMYDPRKVSIRNAEKMGFEACKKCCKVWEELLATSTLLKEKIEMQRALYRQ